MVREERSVISATTELEMSKLVKSERSGCEDSKLVTLRAEEDDEKRRRERRAVMEIEKAAIFNAAGESMSLKLR